MEPQSEEPVSAGTAIAGAYTLIVDITNNAVPSEEVSKTFTVYVVP